MSQSLPKKDKKIKLEMNFEEAMKKALSTPIKKAKPSLKKKKSD